MLGAIIGDIVGSRFEFNNTNKTDFKLFTSECSFTDDTICTIAIADAILRSVSFEQSLLEWCRKYPNPKGAYGCSFSQWINSKTPTPYGSFGNGSAMRVSPCGYLSTRQDVLISARNLLNVHITTPKVSREPNVLPIAFISQEKKKILNLSSNL